MKTIILSALLMMSFAYPAYAVYGEHSADFPDFDVSDAQNPEKAEAHYRERAAYFRNEAEFHRIMKRNATQWSDKRSGTVQFIEEHCDSIIRDLESLALKMERFAEFYGEKANQDAEDDKARMENK